MQAGPAGVQQPPAMHAVMGRQAGSGVPWALPRQVGGRWQAEVCRQPCQEGSCSGGRHRHAQEQCPCLHLGRQG